MAHLIPPMDDEPPADFIAFVGARLTALRSETARLVGGERFAPEVYMEVLADLAGHWRRLCWRSRLSHRDAPGEYLDRRLTTRSKNWREERIYPVEVSVRSGDARAWVPDSPCMRPAAGLVTRPVTASAGQSVARQLAPLLPTTARAEVEVVAEAEIAWVHAYRRYLRRRYCRIGGGIVLLLGLLVQFMSQASAPG